MTVALMLGVGLAAPGLAAVSVSLEPAVGYSVGNSPRDVVLADLDGDGDLDVASAESFANTVTVYLNDGAGTLGSKTTITFPEPPVNEPTAIDAADVDEDGTMDLVVGHQYSNNFSFLSGNGDGSFDAPVHTGAPSQVYALTLTDLNQDGHVDVLTQGRDSNTLYVFLGNGAGGFAAPTGVAMGSPSFEIHVADMNEDGHDDLVLAQSFDNRVAVSLGNGLGALAAPTFHSPGIGGSGPGSLTVADLNGDGHLDVATANVFGDSRSVMLGAGDGTLATGTSVIVGETPAGIRAADFDGDGDSDLAMAFAGDDNAKLFRNDGTGAFGAPVARLVGDSPTALEIGDLNGDGVPDLVVVNEASDNLAVVLVTVEEIDEVDPVITITSPADGSVVLPGASLTADYSCSDLVDPAPSCVGDVADGAAIDTSVPGEHTFSVTSTDAAGNSDTKTSTYRVGYAFIGFAAPVDNLPTVNLVKAGRAIPVKWHLEGAGGAAIDDPASFVSLTSRQTVCGGSSDTDAIEEAAAGNSGLQYLLDGNWQFNWKTVGSYAKSCRVMTVTLADGTTHSALFKFS